MRDDCGGDNCDGGVIAIITTMMIMVMMMMMRRQSYTQPQKRKVMTSAV